MDLEEGREQRNRPLLDPPLQLDDTAPSQDVEDNMGMDELGRAMVGCRAVGVFLSFLGFVHILCLPDWWSGVTDICISLLIRNAIREDPRDNSTGGQHLVASMPNLMLLVSLACLNLFAQGTLMVNLIMMEVLHYKDIQAAGNETPLLVILTVTGLETLLMFVLLVCAQKIFAQFSQAAMGGGALNVNNLRGILGWNEDGLTFGTGPNNPFLNAAQPAQPQQEIFAGRHAQLRQTPEGNGVNRSRVLPQAFTGTSYRLADDDDDDDANKV